MRARPLLPLVVVLLGTAGLPSMAPLRADEIDAARGEALFSRIDEMLGSLSSIMGFGADKPIVRELLTREQITELVESRLEDESQTEQLRREELFLRLFGFVPREFDLAQQVADVLTEQATALYDYKTRKLYLATWTPDDMQEFALVHELAHAIADQRFDLGKFVKRSHTADGDLARSAVIEGQASWVMTEWLFQQTHRSLKDSPQLAAATAGASRYEAESYPVYSSAPLYIKETMLFPYTDGLLFQQRLVEEFGQKGFRIPFETAPLNTRHILNPESYLRDELPTKPRFLSLRLKGYERTSRGNVGQLEHRILVQQYTDSRDTADQISGGWRGGRFEIYETPDRKGAVLRYGSDWANRPGARDAFELYRKVCLKKLPQAELTLEEDDRFVGRSEWGWFDVRLIDNSIASLEGLPEPPAGAEASVTQ
ncbi:MAG: hypothetical protein GC160_29315 [Acidobacteria bacterium]|nr:hypothetical protein [Acidobacteriota bacterium]